MSSLGKDLATIRTRKDLNVDEVQKTTKIPVPILQSIEDDSIFEQLDNNTTYTRNYVRSYARALGIEEKKVVKALNQVEAGTYDGGLIQKDEEDTSVSTDPPESDEYQASNEPKEQTDLSKENKSPQKSTEPSSSSAPKIAPKDWDWVQVGQKTNKPARTPKRKGLLIFILLIIIIVGGFLIYFYFYADSNARKNINGPQTNAVEQPGTPSDSLREALINKGSQPAMAKSTPTEAGDLPDTLTIGIYAAGGELEPVRVFTDILGKRNPYWISQGDTIRFNFVNTVRIRAANQYDHLQILFNGHTISNLYQDYYDNKTKLVELDRSVFENHPRWRRPAQ